MSSHSARRTRARRRVPSLLFALVTGAWTVHARDLGAQGAPAERATSEATPVEQQERERGFLFFPSRRSLHAFRFGLGAFYDAIDPQVMYGYVVRLPQVTADARYGLGRSWSLAAHLNTMLVTSEALLGVSRAWRAGRVSVEASASAGVYVGALGQLSFDALVYAPEARPELAVGHDFGALAATLRGSLILMGPEHVEVGGVTGGLDGSRLFVGHSEMLYVESTTRGSGVWYFGVGALTTRAYYAFWILFPDSPALFTYPRIAAGYAF